MKKYKITVRNGKRVYSETVYAEGYHNAEKFALQIAEKTGNNDAFFKVEEIKMKVKHLLQHYHQSFSIMEEIWENGEWLLDRILATDEVERLPRKLRNMKVKEVYAMQNELHIYV